MNRKTARSMQTRPNDEKRIRFRIKKPLVSRIIPIAVGVAATLILVWSMSKKPEPTKPPEKNQQEQVVTSTESSGEQQREITLEDVRNGSKEPRDYVKQLEKKLAKDRAGLERILYEPSEEEMRILLRENLMQSAVSQEDLEGLLRNEMEYFRFSVASEDNAAFIIPSHPRTLGKKRFIVVRKNPLVGKKTSSTVTEGDLGNKIRHELKHVEDYEKGITVNGVDLFKAVQEKSITKQFFIAIIEARAYHKQLEEILESITKGDNITFSRVNLGTALVHYFRNIFLVMNPSTSYERELGRDALAPCRSIKPSFKRKADRSFTISVTYVSPEGVRGEVSIDYDQNWNQVIPFMQ